MNEKLLPVPDVVSVGLDYLRVSYATDWAILGTADRMMRSRADIMATAMYGADRAVVSLYQSSYGAGYRSGRHYNITMRRDGKRVTEIASGVGARLWSPPRTMTNVSWRRIDVAIDMCYTTDDRKSPLDPVDLAEGLLGRAYDLLVASGKQQSVTRITSDSTTLYLGSRRSERYLRLYNKSADLRRQQLEEPLAIVRVELELKSRGTEIVPTDYLTVGDVASYVWGVVAYMVRRYNLPLLDVPVVPAVYNPRLDEPEEYRTLKWIKDKVLPALKRLSVAGYEQDLRQLGIALTLTGSSLDNDDDVDDTGDGYEDDEA